ncbi:MAG: TatD family hydrolase [Verrucomicrobiales bacterium]
MLVDTHCHLGSDRFANDLPDVIQRAADAGVSRIITIGTTPEESRRAVGIAEQYGGVFAAVGVHPCDVLDLPADWLSDIERLTHHQKVVAIGETGLDYFHRPPGDVADKIYRTRQAECFELQLELAAARHLPVVVHQRGDECWADTTAIVARFSGRVRAVFHCYAGTWADAAEMVTQGHLISFTGVVTYKNAAEIAACAREAQENSFMVETDAPYLAPVPHRGNRCEPAFVRATAEFIAQQRAITLDLLAQRTSFTAREIFKRLV